MMKKDLVSLADLSKKEIFTLFELTKELKGKQKKGKKYTPLTGKSLAMIFQKPSTRTSVSFAVGMYQLGGLPLIFNVEELQLRRGESLADTARVFSGYVNGVMIRTTDHQDVLEFAKYATIPVINGLTNLEHPCQVLSDIYTIAEKLQITDYRLQNLKIVFLGEGNNIANSWIFGAAIMGLDLTICAPQGYEPDKKIYQAGKKIAQKTGAKINISDNPQEAVKNADILYTDVWISMHAEKEVNAEKRKKIFRPYQLNSGLLKRAKPNCKVMHCLPAHRGEEITDEVIDGPNSIVFDQAENRLHLQKALLLKLLG